MRALQWSRVFKTHSFQVLELKLQPNICIKSWWRIPASWFMTLQHGSFSKLTPPPVSAATDFAGFQRLSIQLWVYPERQETGMRSTPRDRRRVCGVPRETRDGRAQLCFLAQTLGARLVPLNFKATTWNLKQKSPKLLSTVINLTRGHRLLYFE